MEAYFFLSTLFNLKIPSRHIRICYFFGDAKKYEH